MVLSAELVLWALRELLHTIAPFWNQFQLLLAAQRVSSRLWNLVQLPKQCMSCSTCILVALPHCAPLPRLDNVVLEGYFGAAEFAAEESRWRSGGMLSGVQARTQSTEFYDAVQPLKAINHDTVLSTVIMTFARPSFGMLPCWFPALPPTTTADREASVSLEGALGRPLLLPDLQGHAGNLQDQCLGLQRLTEISSLHKRGN